MNRGRGLIGDGGGLITLVGIIARCRAGTITPPTKQQGTYVYACGKYNR